jgi:multidrug efflux pump subunit AcrA (membrane-fusion protein)
MAGLTLAPSGVFEGRNGIAPIRVGDGLPVQNEPFSTPVSAYTRIWRNQRTTPEIKGIVTRIGADLTKEAQTNTVFYTASVRPVDVQVDKMRLVPGMPVEAFIATGERTAISYLVKPVTDQFVRAFRER